MDITQSTEDFLESHRPDQFERKETPWTEVGKARLGGRVVVCDPSLYPTGIRVELAPGDYLVTASLVGIDSCFYVSRLRVQRISCIPSRGKKIGTVSVDFGRVTVGDDGRIALAGAQMSQEDVDGFARSLSSGRTVGFVNWGTVQTPYAECGSFGAGEYPVIELTEQGQVIGLEVDLLGDDRGEVAVP